MESILEVNLLGKAPDPSLFIIVYVSLMEQYESENVGG